MPKITLVLDSSQISTYLNCPQKWYNQYVRRIIPIGIPTSSEPMDAGTYIHKLLDIYYVERAKGELNLNSILLKCLSYDPDNDICECGCIAEYHKNISSLNLNECTRCNKCLKYRPHPFPLPLETRTKVRDRFKDYVGKWNTNEFIPLSPKHVEVGFSEPIYEDSENLFVLEGRIDLLSTLQGLKVMVDHKSQMQIHWLYPKSVQFKNYALVSKCNTVIINYIRLHKQITPDTLVRDVVTFNQFELQAWKKELIDIYFRIKKDLLNKSFDKNWDSCKGFGKTFNKNEPKYCHYDNLCTEFNSQMLAIKERTLYKIQEKIWRPW